MKYFKPLVAIAIAVLAIVRLFSGGPIARAAGELAPDAPEQQLLSAAKHVSFGDFDLEPRAAYEIEARVLSVERYLADPGARLSPIDFAMGWGPMSDSAVLEKFRVKQGGRFYAIFPERGAIDLTLALQSSANMHLIPATSEVKEILLNARPGNIAHLRGYLVSASRADGFTWNTSLTRNDTGNGACELMYVESAQLH